MDIKKILKNRNNRVLILILIIGIVIMSVSGMVTEHGGDAADSAAKYSGEEERLCEILSEIDGAGRVSVMMSYVSTMEKDIAYDGKNERAVTSGGDVIIRREVFPEVKGVIVIADGADDPSVKLRIKEAVTAVTGAGANRVCVFTRDEEAGRLLSR